MGLVTKGSIKKAKKMVKESIAGQMVVATKDSGFRTGFQVKENMNGLMEERYPC
jgi:hypothetical protein